MMPGTMKEKLYPSDLASYSNLFQRMLDAVFLLDSETFLIQDVNTVAERVLESDRDRLIGQALTRWVIPTDHEVLLRSMRSARRRYYPKAQIVTWTRSSGDSRMMRLVLCLLTLSDGSGRELIQVIAQDITAEHNANIKAEQYLRELKELASTDEMTGLYNYRTFKQRLEEEHLRSARYRSEYCIVFLDLDHFKAYNDQNGHQAGDALLARLAILIRKGSRNIDIPARYGGEEFAVLCPATKVGGGMILAERLRRMVAGANLPHAKKQPLGALTISVGVAGYPEHGSTADEVLQAADHATYASKNAGRNRVTRA